MQAHGYVKVDPRWISLPASLRSLFKQEAGSAPAKHDIPTPRQAEAVRRVPNPEPCRVNGQCSNIRVNLCSFFHKCLKDYVHTLVDYKK